MADAISSLLRRSAEHLEHEVPDSYRLLVTRFGPMVIELVVDGEVFSLRGGERLHVSDGAAQVAGTRIVTTRVAILDLLDARIGVGEAVDTGRLEVCGSLDDVQRAYDSLLAYVHAAVRAPSLPALMAELRAGSP